VLGQLRGGRIRDGRGVPGAASSSKQQSIIEGAGSGTAGRRHAGLHSDGRQVNALARIPSVAVEGRGEADHGFRIEVLMTAAQCCLAQATAFMHQSVQ
jgi:hypothetical protein